MKKIAFGLLVILEGGEGVGKTTQAKALVNYYNSKGYSAKYFREPGGNKLAEDIRNMVLYNEMDATTETLLMTAARNINVQTNILPALREGNIVILDRFVKSTLVYQGILKNGNMDFIKACNNEVAKDVFDCDGYVIEFTLTCNSEVAMERAASEGHERNKNDILPIEDYREINYAYTRLYNSSEAYPYEPINSIIDTTNLTQENTLSLMIDVIDDVILNCEVYEE